MSPNYMIYLQLQFGMLLADIRWQEEKRVALSNPMDPIPRDDDPAGDTLRLRGRGRFLLQRRKSASRQDPQLGCPGFLLLLIASSASLT